MRRAFLVSIGFVSLAACAQASPQAQNDDDAPPDAAIDAPVRFDAPTSDVDAPTGTIDAPTGTIDAPAGTVDAPPSGSCGSPTTGVLATFDLSGATGDQTSSKASSTATGVTAGALSRASGLTAVSGANSINASGWPTASKLDQTHYFTLTLTPTSGCAMDLTSMSLDNKASSTGPADGAVATSDDAFAGTSSFKPNTSGGISNVTLTVSGATGAVEVRIYGYGASSGSGTMRIENTFTVSGSLH